MNRIGLPKWGVDLAYKFIDVEKNSPIVDERTLEYAFILAKIAKLEPGKLLDIGCTARVNLVPAFACNLHWKVTGLDIRDYNFDHDNFIFLKEDLLECSLPSNSFDLITAVSSIEHIGIKNRYGITKSIQSGDAIAIRNIRNLLKAGGRFLLTIPFGLENKTSNLGRVYTRSALFNLIREWKIKEFTAINKVAMLELEK